MLGVDPPASGVANVGGIPRRFLDGPSIITIAQPDGTFVNISFGDSEQGCGWRFMLIILRDDKILFSPLPPISFVRTERALA